MLPLKNLVRKGLTYLSPNHVIEPKQQLILNSSDGMNIEDQ